jgi:hypothetical protein
LDALRFLRDIAKPKGGGLQTAIEARHGIQKIRCLHARKDTTVLIEVDIGDVNGPLRWTYNISFNLPAKGHREPQISSEIVLHHNENGNIDTLLDRPNIDDTNDPFRRRETHIEQINANSSFRELQISWQALRTCT